MDPVRSIPEVVNGLPAVKQTITELTNTPLQENLPLDQVTNGVNDTLQQIVPLPNLLPTGGTADQEADTTEEQDQSNPGLLPILTFP